MKSAALRVTNVVDASIFGTSAARYASPVAMEQSCILLQSLGVSQMKLAGSGEFSSATNSESSDEVVATSLPHLEGVLMSLNSRNPKWSAARGGLKEHVPEPEASSDDSEFRSEEHTSELQSRLHL